MYNRQLRTFSIIMLIVVFLFTSYFRQDENTQSQNTTMQTVIFKDASDTLIPVAVEMPASSNEEYDYRAILEAMKSHNYEQFGLFPILNDDFEVNTLIIEDNQLTLDCSDSFANYTNARALDFCEALSYLFCINNIERIHMKIEGEPVSSLSNTTIPLSCMTNQLGINNFNCDTSSIHLTSPVTIYNEKTILDKKYYVPTTTRIDTVEDNINEHISLLLQNFDSPYPIETENEAYLQDGHLHVYLSSSILNNSETISDILYERLEKSFLSLKNVNKVSIYIDSQLIETKQVSSSIANEIRL